MGEVIHFGPTALPVDEVVERVRRIACSILSQRGAPDLCLDDVVQDALLYMLRYAHLYDPERSPINGFVNLVARTGIRKHLRRHWVRSTRFEQLPEWHDAPSTEPSPFDEVVEIETKNRLAKAGLRLLTDREKRILTHRVMDTPFKKIGEMESLSVERIRQLQAIALAELREAEVLEPVRKDMKKE